MDALDIAISIVIVLFILSIVTEKFTQLVKNYPSFFNIFLFALSVGLIIRGIIIQYRIETHCFLGLIAITICLAGNLFLVVYFRKRRDLKPTLIALGIGVAINTVSIITDKFVVYFTSGSLILYFSLVSLHLLPEIAFKIKGRWFNTKFFKRIEKVNSSGSDEPGREKEITTLSFLTGICVAYLFKADFFDILNHISSGKNGSVSLSWHDKQFPLAYVTPYFNFELYEFNFAFFLGILLTGFFLSFGSKFFHDLLETLFYAKKAKAAQSDFETFKLDSADKIEKWVNEYDLQKFYLKEAKNILNKNGFTAVGIGKVEFEGKTMDGLRIYANQGHHNIEDLLKIDQGKNVITKVPYQIFVGGGEVVPTAQLEVDASTEITNQKYIKKFGAITHPVVVAGHKGNFLLTCYHVVKAKSDAWDKHTDNSSRVAITNTDQVLGSILYGAKTPFAEAAIIKLDEGNAVAAPFYPGFNISQKKARIITSDDVGTKVLMYKQSLNKIIAGTIVASEVITKVYFDGLGESPHEMYELIEVKNRNGMPIQESGDSGNLLFDEQYRAIGIVFAKNDLTTFVMRLDKALDVFEGLTVTLKL